MKSVIDNVNARGFIRQNLPFRSNMSSLSKLTRLHYLLILNYLRYPLRYFFINTIAAKLHLMHAKFSDLVHISHQKYMYI